MNIQEIKPTDWHYRLQTYVYGRVHYRYHFCPYFWMTIAAIFFAPLLLITRAIVLRLYFVTEKIDDSLNQINTSIKIKRLEKRTQAAKIETLNAQQYIDRYLTTHFDAYKFYHWVLLPSAMVPLARHYKVTSNTKKASFYRKVWDLYEESEAYRNRPFNLMADYSWGLYDLPHSSIAEQRPIYQEFRDKLDELYDKHYLAPKREQEEKIEYVREKRKISRKRQEKCFELIATYTKYPVFAFLTAGAAISLAVIAYGLFLTFQAVIAEWQMILISVGLVFVFLFIVLNLFVAVLNDEEYSLIALPVIIATYPFRSILRFIFFKLIPAPFRAAAYTGSMFLEKLVQPIVNKTINLIVTSFSIFITMVKVLYEGACPMMHIEGDDLSNNPRLNNSNQTT